MKNAYIDYALIHYIHSADFDEKFKGGWMPREVFESKISDVAENAFKTYGVTGGGKYAQRCREIIDEIIEINGFVFDGDEYTGEWVALRQTAKDGYCNQVLSKNPATKRVENLGRGALQKALDNITYEDSAEPATDSDHAADQDAFEVPASDRVVSLKHNQQDELENPLNEVISLVEHENSIDGEDGLRELVVGRLKAGRELVRAGIFSIRSLELTLIVGLKLLVEKYQDHAIGAIAGSLLDLLIDAIRNA